MDPFKEVLADAEQQLDKVRKLLSEYSSQPTVDGLTDINNLMQELTETLHDLSQSIATAQQNPAAFGVDSHEISSRIGQVGHINAQVSEVQEQLASLRTRPIEEETLAEQQEELGELSEAERNLLLQQTMQDQDDILDQVFHTVTALREQANVMSRELEDQAVMLDDFEVSAENTGDRLRQGLKRVDYVLKHNRETLGTCCITLLIIALVILLVLVIII